MLTIESKALLLALSMMGNIITQIQDNSSNIKASRSNIILEKIVIGVLEQAKKIFLTGFPAIGIPILDPLLLDDIPLEFELPNVITAKLNLADRIIGGLSNFNISHLEINIDDNNMFPFDIKIEVTFNNINFAANYNLEGNIADLLELSGKGILAVKLSTFKVGLEIASGTHCDMIILKQFKTSWSLKEAYVLITDFMKNDVLSREISSFLADTLPSLVSDNDWNSLIEPSAKKKINQLLAYFMFVVPDTM